MSAEVQSTMSSTPHFDSPIHSNSAHWPTPVVAAAASIDSPIPSDTSWEMVSPPPVPVPVLTMETTTVSRAALFRQRSSSTSDLCGLKHRTAAPQEEAMDSFPTIPSFRDMVLSKAAQNEAPPSPTTTTKPKLPKRKPKFVVTPIQRCSASTPNLRALIDDDDDEILGDTDASEYYNRKSMGYVGRKNGQKIRPDEAKRRDFSVQKRQMQRQAQK